VISIALPLLFLHSAKADDQVSCKKTHLRFQAVLAKTARKRKKVRGKNASAQPYGL